MTTRDKGITLPIYTNAFTVFNDITGVDPTGIVDVSTLLQTAIDTLAASNGGTILLQGGYNIGTTSILMKNRVKLLGLGFPYIGTQATSATAKSYLKYSGASDAVKFGDGATYGTQGGSMEGIEIFGQNTGTNGIKFHGTAGSAASGNSLRNVHVSNFIGDGIIGEQHAFVNSVEFCSVSKCLGVGVYLKQECNDWTLTDVKSQGNGQNYRIGSGSGTAQSGIGLIRCKAEDGTTEGIYIDSPTRSISIIEPYLEGNGKEPLKCVATTATLNILGGEVVGNSNLYSGINIAAGCIFNISGISFTGNTKYDIDLSSANNYYGEIGPCRHGATSVSGKIGKSTVGSDTLVTVFDTSVPERYTLYGTAKSYGIFNSVQKNTTANRPTLNARQGGCMYLDTTLDADGKPIWWTGTAWVDATGAVV